MRIGADSDVSRRIGLEHWHAQMQAMSSSISRLSSGLRINSAMDDAAGLAIAEKMRSHVLGARQAHHNAQDGISLLRVADGALTGTAGLLQRMRVIAVQAANGTWSDAQRAALQLLMDSSLKAVNEVARTTAYNTIHLLDGSRSGLTLQVGSTAGATFAVDLGGAATADGLGLGTAGTTTTTYRTVTTTTPDQTVTTTTPDTYVMMPGPDQLVPVTTTTYTYAASVKPAATSTLMGQPSATATTVYNIDNGKVLLSGAQVGTWDAASNVVTMNEGWSVAFATSITNGGSGKGQFSLDVTPHTTTTTQTVPGQPVKTLVPGTTTTTVIPGTTTTSQVAETVTTPGRAPSLLSQQGAAAAVDTIDAAIAMLSDRRASIGAAENSLTHAIAALQVQEINLSAAEGRIRDVDVPGEVARLAKLQSAAEASAQAVSQALLSQFAAVNLLLDALDRSPAVQRDDKSAAGLAPIDTSARSGSATSSPPSRAKSASAPAARPSGSA
ncbi:MAG: flagellin [Actinobacteria bacterium]|nr:flagellin [Actinomycetota bacterium]